MVQRSGVERFELAALALVTAVFLVVVASYLATGPQLLGDSQRYLEGAEALLATGRIHGKAGNYKGYILFVAAVKLLIGDSLAQQWVIIYLHALAEGVALLCLYALGRMLFGAPAALISAALYALNIYALRWTPQIGTESLFMAFIIVASWLCVKASQSPWLWLTALPVAVFASSIRPNGIAMLPVFLLFFLLSLRRRLRLAAIALVCAVSLLAVPAVTGELNRLASHEDLVAQLEKGTVIWRFESVEMPRLEGASGDQLVDVTRYIFDYPLETLQLMGRRLEAAWFWQRPDYSDRHNLFLIVLLPGLYVLAAVGLYRQYRSGVTPAHLLPISLVVAQCAVLVISFANHDHRFTTTVMPLVFLYSAHGIAALRHMSFLSTSKARRAP